MATERLGWDVGAMTANQWEVYSVRERLRKHYGYRAKILSILIRNSSQADITEESTRLVVERRERKKVAYPGGADYVALQADAATTAGQVTCDVEIEF